MPVVPGYPDNLQLLATGYYFVQLSLRGRSRFIVVRADLHSSVEDDEIVDLASHMSMPGPDHTRITIREVCLYHTVLAKKLLPVISENLGKVAPFVDVLLDVEHLYTR